MRGSTTEGLVSSGDDSLLRALVDAAPVGAAVVGHDGTIRAWNAAAQALTGWPADEILGRTDPSVPDDDVEATRTALEDLLRDPARGERRVVRRARRDGSHVTLVLDAVTRVELADGPALAVWFSQGTDVDALLLQRNRLSHELLGATRIEEVLPVLTEFVRDVLAGTAAVVLRRCPPGLHVHGLRGLGVETEVAEQVELDLDEGAPWTAAVAGAITDGAIVLDGEDRPACFVPMGPDGDGWVFAVCDVHAEHATPHQRDLLEAVADEAWAALQRVALVADLDGKIEILEATNRLASSVGLDLDDALQAVTRQSAEALSCERAAVYLADGDEVRLAHVHATDASPEQLLAEDDGLALAEEVVRLNREVLFQDVGACEIAEGPWHVDAGSVAVMGLPLQVGQRSVGALVVAHTVAHPRGFTSLCQQVGAAVAQQAALAVEHARLFEIERDTVERLEELDRRKADWMAGVTHDLRAPLTGLLGFVETLRRMAGQVSEEDQQEFLTIMSRQADQLADMVEDLLLSAQIDADAVARRRRVASIAEVVREALESSPEQVREQVELRVDGDAQLVVDVPHLHRVFQNLFTNARRHGGTRVCARISVEDGAVLVAVEDMGPGVPVEDRERIFDRFVHGDDAASSGLGLYVARGIVEAHGGSLVVTDRLDGRSGARFEVRLPEPVEPVEAPAEDVDVPEERRATDA